jgi:hypothetical protein
MLNAFDHLTKTTLYGLLQVSKLREIMHSIDLECVPRLIQSLAENLEQGNSSEASVSLVCIQFGSRTIATSPKTSFLTVESAGIDAIFAEDAQDMASCDILPEVLQKTLEESFREWLEIQEAGKLEMAQLGAYAAENGLLISNVPSDGNCLYHALCRGLRVFQKSTIPGDHISLRKALVQYMSSKEEDWFVFQTTDRKLCNKRSFLRSQAKIGEYRDENVVKAAFEMYGRPIKVSYVQGGSLESRHFQATGPRRGKKPTVLELLLLNYNHYMFACPHNHVEALDSVLEEKTD